MVNKNISNTVALTDSAELQIGGFVSFTTIDFPLVNSSCVVFCQGCTWRCSYCQNKELQKFKKAFSWQDVFPEIVKRKDFIEGVVFSGGEPLAQEALISAIKDVNAISLKIAIHTSGAFPQNLARVLPFIDWVGFDIKTCFNDYDNLTSCCGTNLLVKQCLDILLKSNVEFECRTTVDPAQVSFSHVAQIAQYLHERGVKRYVLQRCFDHQRIPLANDCTDINAINALNDLFPGITVRD
ncbi:MAG: anaerobic ribonucleoside-triphosphate reductase activating protein [Holosporales bacterium]|jgi:pyruvate formate lyase activating enzyme|nr:anaerobic ribonucleoside-triphosphate reductase activating protein [Holosporales bacterium]